MNLVVDFNNAVHRARAGMRFGENSITYTFMLMIRKMVEQFSPSRVYIVREGKAIARKEMFSEYKSQRTSPGDDFWRQHSKILELLSKMPVVIIKHPERECDDTIAHIVNVIRKNEECVVVSSDSDFTQLLSMNDDRVKLYNPIKKSYVEPTHYDYVYWKSLVGDSSDNIPGFRGVGPKKAEKILSSESTLKEFLSEGDNKKIFDRNISLIRFEDIDSGLDIGEKKVDWEGFREEIQSLGFKSICDDKPWKKFVESFSTIGE